MQGIYIWYFACELSEIVLSCLFSKNIGSELAFMTYLIFIK